MSRVKSKHTKLEDKVTSDLWKNGIRYRRNVNSLLGKPDIAIKKYKIVIFVDSCFWHGCELHCRYPTQNSNYWSKKILRNKTRDLEVTDYYLENKWNIFRIWEHDLKYNYPQTLNSLIKEIKRIVDITNHCT